MKPKILFLTNLHNSDPEEDAYLVNIFKAEFDITVSHPLNCEKYLAHIDGIIIRNIWPTYEYAEGWKRIVTIIRDLKIPTYNPLSGKGDIRGKDYLVKLYHLGFPVIPSVDRVEDLARLPASESYYIKPQQSCDGFGDERLTAAQLAGRSLNNYIIQPYEVFVSEPSFFFIDNKFSYAITMPNRLDERNISVYEPTHNDLAFAQKFVDWENLPYGIQRVDAVRTNNGKLFLTEDEDIAEFLYLFDLPKALREKIVTKIVESIKRVFVKS